MMRRIGLGLAVIFAIAGLAVFGLWATSPDPRFNPATFEDEEIAMALQPLENAVTLAQMRREEGGVATFLVVGFDEESATVVDLARLGGAASEDPFAALASIDRTALADAAADDALHESVAIADLLPAAGNGDRHIATGTNFPEHAEEASSESVFNFPKFGTATPARTEVAFRPGGLLDYEVELCLRFDRPIASTEDFDAATKGFFLCGDFTDRATLVRLVDPDNLDSGSGFSDAKSGPRFYPSGAFLVIPEDWRGFIAEERMTTAVNDEPRQDARGGEMTLDFRQLAEKALGDMGEARFLYDDSYHRLSPQPAIGADMTLMSGTSEGVIFTGPTRGDIIEGALWHLFSGRLFGGESAISSIIESFIASEIASAHFLQPGDTVHYRSSSMGDIVIDVGEAEGG